jgi:copper transport protein
VIRLVDGACGIGIVALAYQIPILAAESTGQGIGSLTEHSVLGDTLKNGVGWSVLAGVVALLLLRFAAPRRSTVGRVGVLVGFGAVLASFGVVGHSRTTSPVWLTVLAELCHVAAASVWFGGLALLALDLRARHRAAAPLPAGADVLVGEGGSPSDQSSPGIDDAGDVDGAAGAAALVRRFSGFATVSIVAVLIAGGVLGYLEVRSVRALTTTAYGRLLIAKVSVVLIVALMGAYNHYRLLPSVASFGRPGSAPWRRLRSTVRTEALLLLLVICITAVLGNLVPGRSAVAANKVFTASAKFGDGSINVVVDPARVGDNQLHLYVLDSEGRQVDSTRSMVVELTLPSAGLGPITKVPLHAGPGHYQILKLPLPLPGTWTVEITSALNEFTNNDVTFRVPVRP